MSFALGVLATVVLLYLAVLLAAAYVSVHPIRIFVFLSPGALGAKQEDVEFTSEDGVGLRGWWVDGGGTGPVVILSHGYMMNRAEPAVLAARLAKAGYDCLLYDFRAHGRSTGRHCTIGYLERLDVLAALRFARKRAPDRPIVLWGSSMGAAASAFACEDLADEGAELPAALVLDSSYGRLDLAIGGWWYFLGGRLLQVVLAPTVLFSRLLVPIRPREMDVPRSLSKLGGMPVLMLHGDRDTLAIPSEAVRTAAASQNAKLVWMPNCGHSEGRWLHPELYDRELFGFLESVGGSSRASTN